MNFSNFIDKIYEFLKKIQYTFKNSGYRELICLYLPEK